MTDKVPEIRTCAEAVYVAMKVDPRCRNDDKWLVLQVLRILGFKVYIPYDKMDKMPAFESITRARRKIQEEGEFQANLSVKLERENCEAVMHEINKWW